MFDIIGIDLKLLGAEVKVIVIDLDTGHTLSLFDLQLSKVKSEIHVFLCSEELA